MTDTTTELLKDLPTMIEQARDLGMPITCPDPGTEHGRRLLQTLGVTMLEPGDDR